MGKFTSLISLISTLIWKLTKTQGATIDEQYFITKDFLMSIDLTQKFSSGNDLKFTIESDPPAKQQTISEKISANISQELKGSNLFALKSIYPYIIGVTHDTDRTGKIFTMTYNQETKQYDDAQVFDIAESDYTELQIFHLNLLVSLKNSTSMFNIVKMGKIQQQEKQF